VKRLQIAFAALVFGSSAPVFAEPAAQFGYGLGFRYCVDPTADAFLPPGGGLRVNIAATGIAVPVRGYRASFELLPQDGLAFPDAWRFDADGCQFSARSITNFLPPPIETGCQTLASQSPIASAATTCTFDTGTRRLRVDLAVELTGIASNPNPALAYFVASVPFDHFASVAGAANSPGTCGGVERAMCIRLTSLAIEDGEEHWIEAARPNSVLTVNAAALGGPTACAAVPTRASTWGGLKGSYR
jgi:hypothetical protein